jgi:hypothetical protein
MFTTNPRTTPDFSVRAYEQFMPGPSGTEGGLVGALRALGRGGAAVLLRFLDAMHESRRQQAARILECHKGLVGSDDHLSGPSRGASQTQRLSYPPDTFPAEGVYGLRIRCSITGAPCEGDNAHLCVEWGCARKGGISPISHENFS